ncbi:MAG: hypothetical protein PHQ40_01515 [Anaerolineaceae bacterium]|nr:hypothetical protein [Anaerolineaceae bacterium]
MQPEISPSTYRNRMLTPHGWIGLGLIALFWPLNWLLPGQRTAWAFFPLWLGYCLAVDALALRLNGTSLFMRNRRTYFGLFLVSAPAWWLFELLNARIQNWQYLGAEGYSPLGYFLTATFNFSVVIPAIFGAAELFSGREWVRRMKPGLAIRPDRRTTLVFFAAGWGMLALLLAWPGIFFPLAWLSIFFILEPVNIWLGNPSLTRWTRHGDWRPVISLFAGALLTGFFWEMWNYYSFPKWIYTIPSVGILHVFEMPLLGYGGYLPFALELYALYHLVRGLLGNKTESPIRLADE